MRVSNSLEPNQDGHIVGPDLGPNCKGYQQMLIVAASRQRYKVYCYLIVEAPSFAKGTTVW